MSRLRKEEVAALSGPNEFVEFYARLKTIKDFHRKHPGEVSIYWLRFFSFKESISFLYKQKMICPGIFLP